MTSKKSPPPLPSSAPPPLPPAANAAAAQPPVTRTPAKAQKAKPPKVMVKLVRSSSRADVSQAKSLRGLGLRKLNDVRELPDTPSVRGMIAKVSHLVSIETV